jgi:hypothetical protein
MDERFIQLKTILTVYLQEAFDSVKGLDVSKQTVVNTHAEFGPSSKLASQALGMFYFMIGQNRFTIDRLDSAFKAYIAYIEQLLGEKGISMDKEAKRLKTSWEAHLKDIEVSKKSLEEREAAAQKVSGKEERDVLATTAMKFTEETNYILKLNNVLSLYADYVGYLEEKLGVQGGFMADDYIAGMLKDIYLGLEKQFEFEVERICPRCAQTIMVSPQSPKLICPFCGGTIGL